LKQISWGIILTKNNDADNAEKKTIVKSKEIEVKDVQEPTLKSSDVCKTPSEPGPIPIPYPNIAKSSETCKGTKNVKCDGKEVMLKDSSCTKSSGDEPSHVEEMEEIDTEKNTYVMIKKIMKTKKLGIPIWIWSFIIVVMLLVIWYLSLNIRPSIEPYDYPQD
jgi:hypothetical protein